MNQYFFSDYNGIIKKLTENQNSMTNKNKLNAKVPKLKENEKLSDTYCFILERNKYISNFFQG